MTSLQHDDGIEIIAIHADNHDKHSKSGFYDISTPMDSIPHVGTQGYCHLSSPNPATNSKNTYFSVGNGDQVRVLPDKKEVPTDKQKRVGRVVMAVAGVLLLMSIVLVGVTLTMSDHIDDKVRGANGQLTTSATPRVNRSVSYFDQNDYTAS